MSLPWFRMYARFVTDPVIEELSFEDQRHFVFLLCLKCDGLLDKAFPSADMRERAIARRLGLQGEALTNAKARLVESGLVDENWQPKRWDDLQFQSDNSTERVRRFREKRRGNVSVTAQDQIRSDQNRSEAQKAPSEPGSRKAQLLAAIASSDACKVIKESRR